LHDNGSCLGDVFHPDFQDGRSAFFDISVCSNTQPTFISSSASCAGVAAVAGEVSKDEKHLAAVEKVGSDFIPLAVESFGVWTPLALKMLHLIADCATSRSGASYSTIFAGRTSLSSIACSNWLIF